MPNSIGSRTYRDSLIPAWSSQIMFASPTVVAAEIPITLAGAVEKSQTPPLSLSSCPVCGYCDPWQRLSAMMVTPWPLPAVESHSSPAVPEGDRQDWPPERPWGVMHSRGNRAKVRPTK